MQGFEASGFAEFDRMALLFRRTRELLDLVTATGDLPDGATEMLAHETLPHVEDIEQGFRVSLRASAAGLAELRALIGRAGVSIGDPASAAEARAALIETMHDLAHAGATPPEILPAPARCLAALAHARLVFALLPHTSAEDVRYPIGRRTYADIHAPRGASQLAERIEELERSLWAVATHRGARLSDGSYRRTYGFFDTAARISGNRFLAG
ncbi:MAG: hypothetical protein ACR2H0_08985 [Candidatus Limnocylindrales bacterium]